MEKHIDQYDPNGVGIYGKLFGLPFDVENARIVILPVPWEVTVSYHRGTSMAPNEVLFASSQVDLFDGDINNAWKLGVAMSPISEYWIKKNQDLVPDAYEYITCLEDPKHLEREKASKLASIRSRINEASLEIKEYVKKEALNYLNKGKVLGVLGGEHSCPLGLLEALQEVHEDFGILQIDAHADLREAYEGFTYSHASIMYNAIQLKGVSKIVQVGIRDYCEDEFNIIQAPDSKVRCFFWKDIQDHFFEGGTWGKMVDQMIQDLPQKVYISFDIDGLDPGLCPNTGTPVPGGLDFYQAIYLIKKLVLSGREIIGFDLCEVGYDEQNDWDANVGARVLYHLCNWTGVSQGLLESNQ